MTPINYNKSWWVVGLAAGGLGGDRINNGIVKQKELVIASNKVKLEREKFHHQRRVDTAQNQQRRIDKTIQIHENFNKKMYPKTVRDELLDQINSPAPLWSENLRTLPTQNDNKFGSITLSNLKKSSSDKKYITETSENEYFYPHEFQELPSMSIFSLLIFFLQGILFGLAVKILLEVLYIKFFKK